MERHQRQSTAMQKSGSDIRRRTPQMTAPSSTDIDCILKERFPLAALIPAVESLHAAIAHQVPEASATDADPMADMKAQVLAARKELAALPAEQVAAMATQSRARAHAQAAARDAQRAAVKKAKEDAAEKKRFYNQPAAAARFEFWCKADFWTVDEAAALLLGRDPELVNPKSLAHELSQPTGLMGLGDKPLRAPFHRIFDELRILMSRSEALHGPRLKPASVLAWVRQSGAVKPPERMVVLLRAASDAIAGPAQSAVALAEEPAVQVRGAAQPWTAERRAALHAYREEHGTKAAAEHFGIAQSRVRQLLPREHAKAAKPDVWAGLKHTIK